MLSLGMEINLSFITPITMIKHHYFFNDQAIFIGLLFLHLGQTVIFHSSYNLNHVSFSSLHSTFYFDNLDKPADLKLAESICGHTLNTC